MDGKNRVRSPKLSILDALPYWTPSQWSTRVTTYAGHTDWTIMMQWMLITLATRPCTFKISCKWPMSLWVGFTFYSLICSQTAYLGCRFGLTYSACFACTCNNWISFTLPITSRLLLNTFCMILSLKMYFKWSHVTDSAWTNQWNFASVRYISPLRRHRHLISWIFPIVWVLVTKQ